MDPGLLVRVFCGIDLVIGFQNYPFLDQPAR